MEIINSSCARRTILLVSDGKSDLTELENILSEEYNITFAEGSDRDDIKLHEQVGVVSAAVLCAYGAAADSYSVFGRISRDSMTDALPILIYCGSEADMPLAEECIRRGAVDVIMPPLDSAVILNRVKNAINLKDSATFYQIETMLKELPSNIYLKDAEGRYIFATHYWHHLDSSDHSGWSIRGKTDLDIRKDKENAAKAMESDREIIRTGKGMDYVIEERADGVSEYLELIKRPVKDESGRNIGIIALINDVTERELQRISLEEKALCDELTGLQNRHGFEKYIRSVVEREKSVCIISADCNELKSINDTYGHLVGDEYIRMSAVMFRTVLPETAHIFRLGGDEFVIILPSVDEKTALGYIDRLRGEELHYMIMDRHISVSYGIAEWDTSTVFEKSLDLADRRMYEFKRQTKEKKHA